MIDFPLSIVLYYDDQKVYLEYCSSHVQFPINLVRKVCHVCQIKQRTKLCNYNCRRMSDEKTCVIINSQSVRGFRADF